MAPAFRRIATMSLALAMSLTACTGRSAEPGDGRPTGGQVRQVDDPDPLKAVEAHTAALSADGPYRDPDADEASRAAEAVRLLLDQPAALDRHDAAFGALGFTARHGVDPETGRPYSLFSMSPSAAPAWGVLLVDRSAPVRAVIEVPHPGFDLNTDKLGVAVHRSVPGSVLLVAGAHRQAAGGAADVAHNDRSMFHVLAMAFAGRGLVQLQLHGFADRNLPGSQAVVSPGAGAVNDLARDLADGLGDAGVATCRAWAERCGLLEGTRNEQGRAAAAIGAVFVHLELGWDVRRDRKGRDLVTRTLAAALS